MDKRNRQKSNASINSTHVIIQTARLNDEPKTILIESPQQIRNFRRRSSSGFMNKVEDVFGKIKGVMRGGKISRQPSMIENSGIIGQGISLGQRSSISLIKPKSKSDEKSTDAIRKYRESVQKQTTAIILKTVADDSEETDKSDLRQSLSFSQLTLRRESGGNLFESVGNSPNASSAIGIKSSKSYSIASSLSKTVGSNSYVSEASEFKSNQTLGTSPGVTKIHPFPQTLRQQSSKSLLNSRLRSGEDAHKSMPSLQSSSNTRAAFMWFAGGGTGKSASRLRELMSIERNRSQTSAVTERLKRETGHHQWLTNERNVSSPNLLRSAAEIKIAKSDDDSSGGPTVSFSCPSKLDVRSDSVSSRHYSLEDSNETHGKRSHSVGANLHKTASGTPKLRSNKGSPKRTNPSTPASQHHQVIETKKIYTKIENCIAEEVGKSEQSYGRINQYIFLAEIGCGAFGKVFKCINEDDGNFYACKILSKTRLKNKFRQARIPPSRSGRMLSVDSNHTNSSAGDDYRLGLVKREIAILKKLSKHPNINALLEVVDDAGEDNLYMIFELCQRCLMTISLNQTVEFYNEEVAWPYFRDITIGLEYLHECKIIHRDMKPENLLITFDNRIQIADFGISNMFEDSEEHEVSNGNTSLMFAAPESVQDDDENDDPALKLERGKRMDVWALGATLYCMVHGHGPFQDRLPMLLFAKITNNEVDLREDLSEPLKDLIIRMMDKNAESRITIDEIKVHPWVTRNGTVPLESPVESLITDEVTMEEVENAFSPVIKLVVNVNTTPQKFINIFKGISGSTTMKRPRTMDDLRTVGKSPIQHTKSTQSIWRSAIWRSNLKISPSCNAIQESEGVIEEACPETPPASPKSSKVRVTSFDQPILAEGLKTLGLGSEIKELKVR
ncbi:Calcium/calmodulin-dependent protein kinase kinase 1 [Nowakowskiella sp. JEL0407]|nr:Calcium/calmodulin-dependent protein kinase kinase 1 [Nowakowskiella sp. JEL0407]